MAKDISCYLDFGPVGPRKRSLKSLLNMPLTVKSWKSMPGRYGTYAELAVSTTEGDFLVNAGREEILKQLDAIRTKKNELGETDMSFDCIPRRDGDKILLCPRYHLGASK